MSSATSWILRRRGLPRLPTQFDGLDPLLAKVLYARKIEEPEEIRSFLEADAPLADLFSMLGMAEAVARLIWAISRGEPIAIYGDYDTDGVTATALLAMALEQAGASVLAYIPDRFGESYGLNTKALKELRDRGAGVVVTVDCGIRDAAQATQAAELGLDLVITDHHSVPPSLPAAVAIIDAKQPGCEYPFKDLAGVGVAYRLVEGLYAIWNHMHPSSTPLDPTQFLDLVAIGTVADIVPLTDENRSLVRRGLETLRKAPRAGIAALLDIAGLLPEHIDSQAISFFLAPRLNAAGRIHTADLAYNLLMSTDAAEAREYGRHLEELNRERQTALDAQVEMALQDLGEIGNRKLLFVAGEGYHEGIVGLVASRLSELFHLPALVMRLGEDKVRGSARSIEGYHVTKALETCADLLERFGGHARAAGFTLAPEHLEAFRTRIEEHAAVNLESSPLLQRRLQVDAIVPLADLTMESVKALSSLEPFGEANPHPALATMWLTVADLRLVGNEANHLRLYLADDKTTMVGIAFRMGHLAEQYRVGDRVDVVYTPTLNHYNGTASVELVIEAIRHSNEGRLEN